MASSPRWTTSSAATAVTCAGSPTGRSTSSTARTAPASTRWNAETGALWADLLDRPIDVERVIVVDGGEGATRAGILLAQAVNHANHHREQVCAILTGLGIQPPDIQAWAYAWAAGRIWDRG